MTDDASSATRLKDAQTRAINQSTSQIEKWENLQKEYENLKEKLSTLPQKVEHKMMVPIGSVGLFPGKLIHTNEINVLLGDNWFVQRSAHQASEIVGRRLAILNEKVEDAKKEAGFIESQRKLTEEITADKENDGIIEIKEEEKTPAEIKGGRRIAHVSSHNRIPRKVRKFDANEATAQAANPKLSSKQNDTEVQSLFARLEELELQERLLEGNNSVDGEIGLEHDEEHQERKHDSKGGLVNGRKNESRTKAEEKPRSHVHFQDNSGVGQNSDEPETNHIRFNHTNEVDGQLQNSYPGSTKDSNDTNGQIFKSPADIYDHFIKPVKADEKPLKSILKKERKYSNEDLKPKPILKHSPEHKAEPLSNEEIISHLVEEPKPILKTGPEAVSSVVLEKETKTFDQGASEATQKKPMSRFKASRMKKK